MLNRNLFPLQLLNSHLMEQEDSDKDYSGSMRLYRKGYNIVEKRIKNLGYVRCSTVREFSTDAYIKFFGKGKNEFEEVTHSYWVIVSVYNFEEIMFGDKAFLKELDVNCMGYSFEMIVNGGVVLRKEVDGGINLEEFEDFCEVYWENRKGVYVN